MKYGNYIIGGLLVATAYVLWKKSKETHSNACGSCNG